MGRARMAATYACGALSAVLASAYTWPHEFVRRAPEVYVDPPSKGLVAYIEQLTVIPVWPIVFALSAFLIFSCALFIKQSLKWAHLIAAAFLVGYSAALWMTAIAAPGTFIVSAVLASFAAVMNLSLCDSYAGRPPK